MLIKLIDIVPIGTISAMGPFVRLRDSVRSVGGHCESDCSPVRFEDQSRVPHAVPPRSPRPARETSPLTEKRCATRPSHVPIGAGLGGTRTKHLESSTVRSGSQSDQNGPREKVLPSLFASRARRSDFRPFYYPLWQCRTDFQSWQPWESTHSQG